MSGFEGHMKEYRQISIDRFDKNNIISTAFFLSHCHRDHMIGLDQGRFFKCLSSRENVFLYCSAVSKLLLFSEDIFKPLKPFIRILEIGIATTVILPDSECKECNSVVVTALPAGHCPGSVMFLFEGKEGRALYTGDFRWEKNYATTLPALCVNGHLKEIDSMYVDTTFCIPEAFYIPSRDECLKATASLVVAWLRQSSHHFVHVSSRTKYGHEPLLCHLAKEAETKVHTSKEKVELYEQISELRGIFTNDCSARIHACKWMLQRDADSSLPCGYIPPRESNSDKKESFDVLVVRPSTMWFTAEPSRLQELVASPASGRGLHRTCFSFHSSYSELRDLVSLLKPRRVYPNVLPASDSDWSKVKERLQRFLTYGHTYHTPAGGDVCAERPLGLVKRKRRESIHNLPDSEGLVFDSPEIVKKPRQGSSEDKDMSVSSQKSSQADVISPAKSEAQTSYEGSNSDEDLFANSEEENITTLEEREEDEAEIRAPEGSQSLRYYVSGDEEVPEEDQMSFPQFRHIVSKDDFENDPDLENFPLNEINDVRQPAVGLDDVACCKKQILQAESVRAPKSPSQEAGQPACKKETSDCEPKDCGDSNLPECQDLDKSKDKHLQALTMIGQTEKSLIESPVKSSEGRQLYDSRAISRMGESVHSGPVENVADQQTDIVGKTISNEIGKVISDDNFLRKSDSADCSHQSQRESECCLENSPENSNQDHLINDTSTKTYASHNVEQIPGHKQNKPGPTPEGEMKEDSAVNGKQLLIEEPKITSNYCTTERDTPPDEKHNSTCDGNTNENQRTDLIISDSDSDNDCKITKSFIRKLGYHSHSHPQRAARWSASQTDTDKCELFSEQRFHKQSGLLISSSTVHKMRSHTFQSLINEDCTISRDTNGKTTVPGTKYVKDSHSKPVLEGGFLKKRQHRNGKNAIRASDKINQIGIKNNAHIKDVVYADDDADVEDNVEEDDKISVTFNHSEYKNVFCKVAVDADTRSCSPEMIVLDDRDSTFLGADKTESQTEDFQNNRKKQNQVASSLTSLSRPGKHGCSLHASRHLVDSHGYFQSVRCSPVKRTGTASGQKLNSQGPSSLAECTARSAQSIKKSPSSEQTCCAFTLVKQAKQTSRPDGTNLTNLPAKINVQQDSSPLKETSQPSCSNLKKSIAAKTEESCVNESDAELYQQGTEADKGCNENNKDEESDVTLPPNSPGDSTLPPSSPVAIHSSDSDSDPDCTILRSFMKNAQQKTGQSVWGTQHRSTVNSQPCSQKGQRPHLNRSLSTCSQSDESHLPLFELRPGKYSSVRDTHDISSTVSRQSEQVKLNFIDLTGEDD